MVMLMNKKRLALSNNQEGFAALVIAIVLILVLSLLTIGFADLMRKEEKAALDKHLSTQAYYAAEAGINDAAKAINDGLTTAKTSCGKYSAAEAAAVTGGSALTDNTVGAAADNVSYSCLLIDPSPKSLVYGPTDETQSKVVEVSGTDPDDPALEAPIEKLIISWEDSNKRDNFVPSGNAFTTTSSWPSATGVVRLGITPLVNGGIERNTLKNSTYAGFLYPNAGGTALTSVAAYPEYPYADSTTGDNSGTILNGNCNKSSQPRMCNVTITGLTQVNYLLTLRWIYSSPSITIQAIGNSGRVLRIKNAQTLVDSTGKAQDVLRRIQVRIPAHTVFNHTDYSLEAMNGICKQLQIFPDDGSRGCQP